METASNSFHGPSFSLRNRMGRAAWHVVYVVFFRPSPRPFHGWRRLLLRVFGAKIGKGCHIYPHAKIWAPWNLRCGAVVGVADGAELYNPAVILLEDYATVSQNAYLCAASHDYSKGSFPVIAGTITLKAHAWVSARAIVLMGVTISEGCVIGAGSVVTKDMPAWTICGGNPCKPIRAYERDKNR